LRSIEIFKIPPSKKIPHTTSFLIFYI
jgi:hypothetical protein